MKSKVFEIIKKEKNRQKHNIELIASENFVSKNVMKAVGSCLTNKYAEGYPDKSLHLTGSQAGRYYGGCQYIDELEQYCCDLWQQVFKTNYHVNVQPHSGSQANAAAYMALLRPGDTVLAMGLSDGGHLSHGSPVNFSGKLYNFVEYGLNKDGLIDYVDIKEKIIKYKPKLVLAGASAYSWNISFDVIKNIIDNCGLEAKPLFMVDMAHIAGLVAAGVHPSPFGYADIITTTTQKTLRGPRGGLIFCKPEFAKKVDSAVFPGTQGGPLEHVIAGKAVAAEEALTPEFKEYIKQVVKNSKAMCDEFWRMGYSIVAYGTSNHMFLIDLSTKFPNLTGKMVQDELDKHGITLNKNCVPGEKRKPSEASGLRIGTAAMTTKGYKEKDFIEVAHKIDSIIKNM